MRRDAFTVLNYVPPGDLWVPGGPFGTQGTGFESNVITAVYTDRCNYSAIVLHKTGDAKRLPWPTQKLWNLLFQDSH